VFDLPCHSHIHYQIDFDQSFFLNSWRHVQPHFMGLKPYKWMPKFDILLALLWWKSQTVKCAPLFWNQTFSILVITNFFEFSYFGDFIISQFCL
jgi:hypothetical protein